MAQSKNSNASNNDQLRVSMLGNFSIVQESTKKRKGSSKSAQNPEVNANLTGRAKRLWLLIAYLIVNRDRGVPPHELIDLLWPEVTSDKPASTLQNNVSRARAIFSDANFSDARDLIKYTDGLYYWAPTKKSIIDAEEFEARVHKIEQASLAENPDLLELANETCEMYKGDFLSAIADVSWCGNMAVYYRALFKRLCKITVPALMEAGRLKEAQKLCLQVTEFDPAAEDFSALLMQAFIMDDSPSIALDHYNNISTFLAETYDVEPSIELETQRDLAQRELSGSKMTEHSIRSFLLKPDEDEGAFACSNAVFREIVLLRIREMARSGAESHIVAITLDNKSEAVERRVVDAKRVSQVLSNVLRASDPFTKVGTNQFLVLLPGANEENALMVYERIVMNFKKAFPSAGAAFDVSLLSLGDLFTR